MQAQKSILFEKKMNLWTVRMYVRGSCIFIFGDGAGNTRLWDDVSMIHCIDRQGYGVTGLISQADKSLTRRYWPSWIVLEFTSEPRRWSSITHPGPAWPHPWRFRWALPDSLCKQHNGNCGVNFNSGGRPLQGRVCPKASTTLSFILLSPAVHLHFRPKGGIWDSPSSRPTAKPTPSRANDQLLVSEFKANRSPK